MQRARKRSPGGALRAAHRPPSRGSPRSRSRGASVVLGPRASAMANSTARRPLRPLHYTAYRESDDPWKRTYSRMAVSCRPCSSFSSQQNAYRKQRPLAHIFIYIFQKIGISPFFFSFATLACGRVERAEAPSALVRSARLRAAVRKLLHKKCVAHVKHTTASL